MSKNSKITRTQIADLPEINVELSDNELRIVSGGLKAAFMCFSRVAVTSTTARRGVPTDYNTNGDHDAD
jgi:hypothetical protein